MVSHSLSSVQWIKSNIMEEDKYEEAFREATSM